jgi:transcription elongation GreA/GreB family factor
LDNLVDKRKLVLAFIDHLQKDLLNLKAAAQATYEAATHEESKPENEYDTRAIEASYLAGAQSKRAAELDEIINLFQQFDFKLFSDSTPVSSSALVEVQAGVKRTYLLLMPKGGGFAMDFNGQMVQVITPNSLLGEALVGLTCGEIAEVEVGGRLKEYSVLSVQ